MFTLAQGEVIEPEPQPEPSDDQQNAQFDKKENEGKSLLEEMWEIKHPDEVKKMKEADEQKRLAKEAKEM